MKFLGFLKTIMKILLLNSLLMLYIGVTVTLWKSTVDVYNHGALIDACSFLLYLHYVFLIALVYFQLFVPGHIHKEF